MRKIYWAAVAAIGLLIPAVTGQDPDPDGPGKLEITTEAPESLAEGAYAKFTVKSSLNKGDKIDWEVAPKPVRAERIGSVLIVDGVRGTTYTLKVQIIGPEQKKGAGVRWDKGVVEYTFGGKKVDPIPPGPVPPGPTPVPPPPPTPDPSAESPFKEAGLRALYLYEVDDLYSYPPVRYTALYDGDARDYLNAKCVPGPDGETREWRKWDKDVDVSKETKVWQDAVARARVKHKEWEVREQKEVTEWNLTHADPKDQKAARSGLPWLMVGDGKTGWEGPLLTPEQGIERLRAIGK